MARILTTLPISDITGRLSGTTFQRTGSGLCAQTLGLPPLRTSKTQYKARQGMQVLGGIWRGLTQTEKDTWAQHVVPPLTAYALFMQVNLPMSYIGNPPFREYQPPNLAIQLNNVVAQVGSFPDPEVINFYITATTSQDIENYPWNQRTFIDVPSSPGVKPTRANATQPTDADYNVSGTSYEFFTDNSRTPNEPQWLTGVTVGVWIQLYSEDTGLNIAPELYAEAVVPNV